jgi:hypothetical protein
VKKIFQEEQVIMNKTGLSRPGAIQMIASATLMLAAAVGPVYLAASRPTHEWLMVLSGFPALAMSLAGVVLLILYFIGFLKFCSSKGYSKWLGFWLFFGNFPGFIALLLLPDLKAGMREQVTSSKSPCEVSV